MSARCPRHARPLDRGARNGDGRCHPGLGEASEAETRLELLDTQIEMVKEAATLVRQKGWRVRAAVGCLAIAAALVVAGRLTAIGGRLHA
jgi:hypothetical protein